MAKEKSVQNNEVSGVKTHGYVLNLSKDEAKIDWNYVCTNLTKISMNNLR